MFFLTLDPSVVFENIDYKALISYFYFTHVYYFLFY